jgi:hypothetical protein
VPGKLIHERGRAFLDFETDSETWSKYRKEDPRGLVVMRHIVGADMPAAFKRPCVFFGSDPTPHTDIYGKTPAWDTINGTENRHQRGPENDRMPDFPVVLFAQAWIM